MRSTLRLTYLLAFLALLAFVVAPVRAADKFKRIAVMDFENTAGDKTLDWVGVGIAETLSTELGRLQDLTLVERKRLNDALKEIKFGRSESVDQATAQKMGKMLGADSIVVGSFQKFQSDLRINARVIDVETGQVRSPARVDGAYNDMLKLQVDLAKGLVQEMRGSLAEAEKQRLETLPSKSVDALQALADGAYFLRNDLTADALKEFDRAIALDPNYTEAHFYRGMALAKQKQWDDAITSFKRTLPRTQTEQRVKWNWNAPYTADNSQRGVLMGIDVTGISTQGTPSATESAQAQKRVVYTERSGKNTVLHFVDVANRSSVRTEIPDDTIPLSGGVPATDQITIVPAATPASVLTGAVGLYGISSDGAVLWHTDLKGEAGKRPPDFDLRGQTLFEMFSNDARLVAVDAVTLKQKWERTHLIVQTWNFRTKGDLALITSPTDNKIHGVRLSDGQDAWTTDFAASSSYQLATDQALIVFDADRRVFAVDLQTGKTFAETAVAPLVHRANANIPYMFSVPALVQDNVLYFVSAANELFAIDLSRGISDTNRLRWKTALQKNILSLKVNGGLLYAGSESGELLIVDIKSGKIAVSKKVADKGLASIVYAGDDIVLAVTSAAVMAFDPRNGNKLWDAASITPQPGYFKGVVLIRPSLQQIAAVDAVTGNIVWQNTAVPYAVWFGNESVVVLETAGVKEYALDRSATQGITNKEAMTELASALLSKGSLDEAAVFAERVARDADPNYPPLRYVQAKLNQARGNADGARREFVTYVDLVGRQSTAGQDVIAELKRESGLLWQTENGGQGPAISKVVEGKVLSVGNGSGTDKQLVALDVSSGKTLWRQNGAHFINAAYDEKDRRVFYLHGVDDLKVAELDVVGLDGASRKELGRVTMPANIAMSRVAYANGRVFVEALGTNLQSGQSTIRVSAFNATSGSLLWEKNHEYTAAQMAQIRVVAGLFYPRGDFFVYSSGPHMWILQGGDGAIYAEDQEATAIAAKVNPTDAPSVDPDITYFVLGSNDLVAYRISSKQVISRSKIPGQDPAFSSCACNIRGTTLFDRDGVNMIAYDLSASSGDANRIKWRISPGPNQRYAGVASLDDALIVARVDNATSVNFVEIDIETGKVLREFKSLWIPNNAAFSDNKMYAFTPEGMAYAMEFKNAGK